MIPHDDELVQQEATFAAVVSEDVEQKIAERLGLKNQSAFEGDRRCEEGSDLLWSEGHERDEGYITRGARVAPALKRIVLAIRDCREAWKASLPRMNAGASTSVCYRGQTGLAEAPEKLGLAPIGLRTSNMARVPSLMCCFFRRTSSNWAPLVCESDAEAETGKARATCRDPLGIASKKNQGTAKASTRNPRLTFVISSPMLSSVSAT